jgi:hypothetical protein
MVHRNALAPILLVAALAACSESGPPGTDGNAGREVPRGERP